MIDIYVDQHYGQLTYKQEPIQLELMRFPSQMLLNGISERVANAFWFKELI